MDSDALALPPFLLFHIIKVGGLDTYRDLYPVLEKACPLEFADFRVARTVTRVYAGIVVERMLFGRFLHCEYGPAYESYHKGVKAREEWWDHGELHRRDGPAVLVPGFDEQWWCYGRRHRVGGPARTCWREGRVVFREWARNGLKDREDGPALEIAVRDGTWIREYWAAGELLRSEQGEPGEHDNFEAETPLEPPSQELSRECEFRDWSANSQARVWYPEGTIYIHPKDGPIPPNPPPPCRAP